MLKKRCIIFHLPVCDANLDYYGGYLFKSTNLCSYIFFIFLCDKHYEKKKIRFRELIPNLSIVFKIFYFIAFMTLSLYKFLK